MYEQRGALGRFSPFSHISWTRLETYAIKCSGYNKSDSVIRAFFMQSNQWTRQYTQPLQHIKLLNLCQISLVQRGHLNSDFVVLLKSTETCVTAERSGCQTRDHRWRRRLNICKLFTSCVCGNKLSVFDRLYPTIDLFWNLTSCFLVPKHIQTISTDIIT